MTAVHCAVEIKTKCPQAPGCHEGYEEFHSWELLSTDEESYEEQLAREYGEAHISRIINV